ncbi:MAG: hypothetical protein ACE5GA_10050 [Candidatus Zixiibacteriota bacterium]
MGCGAALGLTLTLNSCKDDIILPIPRGIEGEYRGLLIITEEFRTGNLETTDTTPVVAVFRLGADASEQAGTYAHFFDTTNTDTSLTDVYCDITLGTWSVKDGKLLLAPGPTDPGSICNPQIVPNSFIESPSGVIEIGFGFTKLKIDPVDVEIGDSLVLRQERFTKGLLTVFKLELETVPES